MNIEVNKRFKSIRQAKGLTQKEFGEILKLSQTHTCDLENGNKKITDRLIDLLELKLGVNREWLELGIGEMFKNEIDGLNITDPDVKDFMAKYVQLDDEFKKYIKEMVEFTLTKSKKEN